MDTHQQDPRVSQKEVKEMLQLEDTHWERMKGLVKHELRTSLPADPAISASPTKFCHYSRQRIGNDGLSNGINIEVEGKLG